MISKGYDVSVNWHWTCCVTCTTTLHTVSDHVQREY